MEESNAALLDQLALLLSERLLTRDELHFKARAFAVGLEDLEDLSGQLLNWQDDESADPRYDSTPKGLNYRQNKGCKDKKRVKIW